MDTVKLLILDVDGVLTSGALPYGPAGNEEKTFFVQDGLAIRIWLESDGQVAIISGRASPSVARRAQDLGIRCVQQGVADKLPVYERVCRTFGVQDEAVSVVGDDLLDIDPMRRSAYPIAVANAVPPVKRTARYVTRCAGGAGAVGEAVERLMRHNGTWSRAFSRWGV